METTKDKIANYYSKARAAIKQNDPKTARSYVLAILNCALETYKRANTIYLQAKTKGFLDTWIAVSRDLYDKGITDYVLECFGLLQKSSPQSTKSKDTKRKSESEKVPADKQVPSDRNIDIAGLIEEPQTAQGWKNKVYNKNKMAVVEISVSDGGKRSTGTGFIVSRNGYLLTNDHVVYDENSMGYYKNVKMSFVGDKKSYKLNVLFSDKKADIALCSFNPEEVGEFSVVKRISDYSRVEQADECLVIGNSFGKGLSPFAGTVRFPKDDSGNLVYTAQSNPGDSGGPVLNVQGECIGINKSKIVAVNNVSADGFANATPMDEIDKLLKKWCESNNITL